MRHDLMTRFIDLKLLKQLADHELPYGNLMSALAFSPWHGTIQVDKFNPNQLISPGRGTILLDRPVSKLTPDSMVKVVNVTILADAEMADEDEDEDKADANKDVRYQLNVKLELFIARGATLSERYARQVNQIWRSDPERFAKALAMSGLKGHQMITLLSAEARRTARRMLGIIEAIDTDAEVRKVLRRVFPDKATFIDKHAANVDEMIERISIRATNDEVYLLVALYVILYMRFDERNHEVLVNHDEHGFLADTLFRDMNDLQNRRYDKLGKRVSTKLVASLAGSSLANSAGLNTIADVLDAVDAVLVPGGLDVNAVDDVKLTDSEVRQVLMGIGRLDSFNAMQDSDSDDLVEHAARYDTFIREQTFLNVIRRLVKMFSTERKLAEEALDRRERDTKVERAARAAKEEAEALARGDALAVKLAEQTKLIGQQQLSIDKLTVELEDTQAELADVKALFDALETARDDEETTDTEEVRLVKYPAGTVLVGGHPAFQKRFAKAHPHVRILSGVDGSVNFACINPKTTVLVNPLHMAHKVWFKLSSVMRQHGLKPRYVTQV